jgi:hypothetical protein
MEEVGLGLFFLVLIGLVGLALFVFIWLLPGFIATSRNHAYSGIVWVLAIVGIANGLTWVIAIVWSLWPREKSLADPLIGNVTGTGSRNSGDTIGAIETGRSLCRSAESDLRTQLQDCERMLESGLITKEEYTERRRSILKI